MYTESRLKKRKRKKKKSGACAIKKKERERERAKKIYDMISERYWKLSRKQVKQQQPQTQSKQFYGFK